MISRSFVAVALLSFSASYTLAQQSPAPDDGIVGQSGPTYNLQVTTTEVSLDVVLTDRKGNTVNNLKKGDFEILEGKIPQEIRGFDPYPWQLTAGWQSEQFAQSFMALDQVAKAVAGTRATRTKHCALH